LWITVRSGNEARHRGIRLIFIATLGARQRFGGPCALWAIGGKGDLPYRKIWRRRRR
jgi:hypothetical protein